MIASGVTELCTHKSSHGKHKNPTFLSLVWIERFSVAPTFHSEFFHQGKPRMWMSCCVRVVCTGVNEKRIEIYRARQVGMHWYTVLNVVPNTIFWMLSVFVDACMWESVQHKHNFLWLLKPKAPSFDTFVSDFKLFECSRFPREFRDAPNSWLLRLALHQNTLFCVLSKWLGFCTKRALRGEPFLDAIDKRSIRCLISSTFETANSWTLTEFLIPFRSCYAVRHVLGKN